MKSIIYPISGAALHWLEIVLAERFGHTWRLARTGEGLRLSLVEVEGAIVFDTLCEAFTLARSDHPFTWWYAEREGWASLLAGPLPSPGVSELASPLVELCAPVETRIHYDILGLTYWTMARVEEIGRIDLDSHERFAATSSHAFKQDYLERPIVDEWLHILGQIIKRTWPGIELKQHKFSQKVSHDVDVPSRYAFRSWLGTARAMVGDIVKRRDFATALRAPWLRLASGQALHVTDPDNTFDWIMDVSESHGLVSAFYFICGRTSPRLDADYEPEHPAIRSLMRRIYQRGHEIGLHPSYNTYQTPSAIIIEANRLRAVAEVEGIKQSEWGGRMHYLRWEHPTTLRAWEEAGMSYDSTLGYADRPGFRCGTCHEYPGFDPIAQETLKIRIRPLVAMECTVVGPHYMGLGTGEVALAKFKLLKDACRVANGCFTLLWHNSELRSKERRELYKALLVA